MDPDVNENADLILVRKLLFQDNGLELKKFSRPEMMKGRTPDYRVLHNGKLVAFCEVKSPRDDWLDIRINSAKEGQIVGGMRDDPIFNRIARHIVKASSQFNSVNKNRDFPNILVFVNHDKISNFSDLYETVTGDFVSEKGEHIPTVKHISEGKIREAKVIIDAYIWIESKEKRVTSFLFNQFQMPHVLKICELLNIDSKQIKPNI
jgi:hypothetical protein